MRLRPEPRFTSFYESFSDLIFATMAIFVLLMMIFLTQVGESAVPPPDPVEPTPVTATTPAPVPDQTEVLRELERQVMNLQRRLSEQRQASREASDTTNGAAAAAARELDKLRGALEPRPIELFILIDGSATMGNSMSALREAVDTIVRVLPEVAPQFRIAIIAYRRTNDANLHDISQYFPADLKHGGTQLYDVPADDEDARDAVLEFTADIEPTNALAPVEAAVLQALAVMNDPGRDRAQQTLVIMGDVGPGEMNHNAEVVYDAIRTWVAESNRRNVISVFDAATRAPQPDRPFFESVAAVAGQPDNFTDQPDEVLALIIRGIMDRSGEAE
ncbi:MAG: hypothetical protein ACIAXF_01510 [Phycisphaerales bacterium JB063]